MSIDCDGHLFTKVINAAAVIYLRYLEDVFNGMVNRVSPE